MTLDASIYFTDWFQLRFIENNGMAFGMSFLNKYVLTIFRIVAVTAIGIYIHRLIKRNARLVYIVLLSLVFAGALGNIFDSVIYGLIFSSSSLYEVAVFVPFGHGYADFLTGKVVDMLYFPLVESSWPQWMPIIGGDHFVFFSPVFNFADACVSVGVVGLVLFCRKELEMAFGSSNETE